MSIKGVVVNDATGLPIVGSSVFISNSSKGTVSNNSGQFEKRTEHGVDGYIGCRVAGLYRVTGRFWERKDKGIFG